MWRLLIIALLFISIVTPEPHEWGSSCPNECTCHITLFKELSLHRWLREHRSLDEQKQSKPTKPPKLNNEVFYEEDMYSSGDPHDFDNTILKRAICVLQQEKNLYETFDKIPHDVQVLTLLQGSNSGTINLEFQHTHSFQNLMVLEVLGYDNSVDAKLRRKRRREGTTNGTSGEIILHDDFMKHLKSLQYVNLQNVKLHGRAQTQNLPSVLDNTINDFSFNEISDHYKLGNAEEQYLVDGGKSDLQHVSFVTPDTSDNDILPYGEYIKEQQNAGLSLFAGLSQLTFLRIANCGLQKVNWEMFEGLSALEYLSLERNHLLFLPEFAFHGTPNLKTLSLARNKLLNLHSTCLAGLLELEKLDLSHNNFSHLSELSLPPFPKLHTANFKHNPLEAIFASTFEIMNATTVLYIGGDDSTLDIKPNSFVGLQALKKLHIYNVGIPVMEREVLKGMPKLKDLEITGSIDALSYDAFLEVPKLEKLILKKCNLKTISMDAFYGLYSLVHLDLSNNILESLPPNLFDQQTSLKELLLHNNRLTELPTGFFRNVPAKMIRLDGNPWHCSCAMSDWQPVAINKVKQQVKKFCDFKYDKGSMCKVDHDEYVFDKKVVPRCSTPKKYKNWTVFHTLRKELRCSFRKHFLKEYRQMQTKKQSHSRRVLQKHKQETKPEVMHHLKENLERMVTNNSQKLPSHQYKPGEQHRQLSIQPNTVNVTSKHKKDFKLPSGVLKSVNKKEHTEQAINSSNINNIQNGRELIPSAKAALLQSGPNKANKTTEYSGVQNKVEFFAVEKPVNRYDASIYQRKKQIVQEKQQRLQNIYPLDLLGGYVRTDTVSNVPQKVLNIYDSNGEISKKAWKLELKRRHEEKLRKYANL